MPLGYKTALDGIMKISIGNLDDALASSDIYLEDRSYDTIDNLKASDYSFATTAGTFDSRFVLRYRNETLSTNTAANSESITIYKDASQHLAVHSGTEDLSQIWVFDISGRVLNETSTISRRATLQNLPSTNQVLLVEIRTDGGQRFTKKIIF